MAVQIAKVLGLLKSPAYAVPATSNWSGRLGADYAIDYTKEDFTQSRQRFDVVLDNVLNHPPKATARCWHQKECSSRTASGTPAASWLACPGRRGPS